MPGAIWCRTLSFAILSVLTFFSPPARAQIRFDLPAQPLAQALTTVGTLASLNIYYDPPLVRGLLAPTLKAELNPDEALARLLSGTRLRAVHVNESTVRVVEEPLPNRAETSRRGDGDAQYTPMSVHLAYAAAEPGPAADRYRGTDESAGTGSSDSDHPERNTPLEEVVVTGTHIHGAERTSPVITINRTDIERSGYQTAGDVVRNLPQSFSGGLNVGVVGAGGDQNIQSASGASTPNLRGLGSDSTLTLVDGHRLAYAEQTNAVDVNLIPLAAIERVEVLTDGASAIYGSDAVGGVVNFILRNDFDGLNLDAATGITTEGGGTFQRYDALAGKHWDDGRALISYEFEHQNEIDSIDRTYISPSLAGTSLLPKVRRNSFFVKAAQNISSDFDLQFEGLYTKRHNESTTNNGPYVPSLLSTTQASVKQYGVVVTGTQRIAETWRASLSLDVSGNAVDAPLVSTLYGLPDPPDSTGQTFDTRLRSLELTGDGVIITLPTGPAKLAAGTGYREETLSVATVPLVSPAVSAKRHAQFAFAETLLPFVARSAARRGINALDLSIAARYENYSDFGSSTNPKVSLVYVPMQDLQLRGSWGRSFRAPSLFQEHSIIYAELQELPPGQGPSPFLLLYGSNPTLQPEKSSAFTVDLEIAPTDWPTAKFDVTYYSINYKGRIGHPTANTTNPFSDPSFGPFVTLNPSSTLLAALLSQAVFFNFSTNPYDPASVAAVADDRLQNAFRQKVDGVDAVASDRVATNIGDFEMSLNVAYLHLQRQITNVSPYMELSGTVFNPPKYRGRAGVTWQRFGWSVSSFANYTGTSLDPDSTPTQKVSSWTTIDGQIAYVPPEAGPLKGFRISVSGTNLFNRRPPYIEAAQSGLPGLHFDATNASAVGRAVSLAVSKAW